jgi:hypothetical protein
MGGTSKVSGIKSKILGVANVKKCELIREK